MKNLRRGLIVLSCVSMAALLASAETQAAFGRSDASKARQENPSPIGNKDCADKPIVYKGKKIKPCANQEDLCGVKSPLTRDQQKAEGSWCLQYCGPAAYSKPDKKQLAKANETKKIVEACTLKWAPPVSAPVSTPTSTKTPPSTMTPEPVKEVVPQQSSTKTPISTTIPEPIKEVVPQPPTPPTPPPLPKPTTGKGTSTPSHTTGGPKSSSGDNRAALKAQIEARKDKGTEGLKHIKPVEKEKTSGSFIADALKKKFQHANPDEEPEESTTAKEEWEN